MRGLFTELSQNLCIYRYQAKAYSMFRWQALLLCETPNEFAQLNNLSRLLIVVVTDYPHYVRQ